MQMSLTEFALVLPDWYDKFTTSNKYYNSEYARLLEQLSLKAGHCGYLELNDLRAIADWGGNQHGRKRLVSENNTDEEVRAKTAQAIRVIDNPQKAIESILGLKQWGLSYGSKTLAFVKPSHAMLDEQMCNSLQQVLPPIHDVNSSVRGYTAFLKHCTYLQGKVDARCPETEDQWRFLDIGQALFQFAQNGGVIVP